MYKGEGTQEPWRRGATDFCRLSHCWYHNWTKTNHQGKQLSFQSQKGKKIYVSIRVQRKTNG